MKKTIIALLLLATVFSVLSCAKRKPVTPAMSGPENLGEVTTSDVLPPDADESSDVLPPDADESSDASTLDTVGQEPEYALEVMDFNGMSYRVSAMGTSGGEFFADENHSIRGIGLELWVRNTRVEDIYNVKLVHVPVEDNTMYGQPNEIIANVLAGFDLVDVALVYSFNTHRLVSAGAIIDLTQLEYNDFQSSYWMNGENEGLKLNGVLYSAVGDISPTVYYKSHAIFMNLTLSDGYGITEEVLELVRNNDWTLDSFTGIATSIYDDVDGVAGKSLDDVYGFATDMNAGIFDTWQISMGLPMVTIAEDGTLASAMESQPLVSLAGKIAELYNHENVFRDRPITHPVISNGKAAFWCGMLDEVYYKRKNMEDDFMVLPVPKLNDSQEKYITALTQDFRVFTVPKTCNELTMVSIVSEALSYESEKIVVPAIYNDILSTEHKDDPVRRELLDLIFLGRRPDPAQLYTEQNNMIRYIVRNAVYDGVPYIDMYGIYKEKIEFDLRNTVTAYRDANG